MHDGAVDDAYSEQIFFALLEHCNSSQDRLDALTRVALRHLSHAVENWAAIRRALVREAAVDTNSDASQALWFLVDALLKHAPHVFVPIVSPRLVELAIQYMPWHVVRWNSTTTTAAPTGSKDRAGCGDEHHMAMRCDHKSNTPALFWCEELICFWEDVLPRAIWTALERHRCLCRSEAQLNDVLFTNALLTNTGNRLTGASTGQNGIACATSADALLSFHEELHDLQEEWTALGYRCQAMMEEHRQKQHEEEVEAQGKRDTDGVDSRARNHRREEDGATSALERQLGSAMYSSGLPAPRHTLPSNQTNRMPRGTDATATTTWEAIPASSPGDDPANDGDANEEEDDYAPEYVSGAVPRALPSLGLPVRRRRREAQCRPREDDF